MIGLDKDCLLTTVDEKNKVKGSVLLSEYIKNPREYRVLCIRVIPISEDKEFILSQNDFFKGSNYDTPYWTFLKYREDFPDALKRLEESLSPLNLYPVVNYHCESDVYDANVFLYYVRQTIEEAKAKHENIVCYPSGIGTDDIIENEMLFSEIGFLKTNIIPFLDIDIQKGIDL